MVTKKTKPATPAKTSSKTTNKSKEDPNSQVVCTPDICVKVIELIEMQSISFSEACKKHNVAKSSAWVIIHNDRVLDERYARAREARGDTFGENVAAISMATLAGKYKPDAARVAIDGLKWTAGRMAPKNWGDKVSHEHGGAGGGPIKHGVTVLTPAQMAALSEDDIKAMVAIGEKLFSSTQTDSNEK